ncbi:Y_Y_Y domain-containing protein [Mucilaginibacter mallensis]|uniref:Y_Y_Y domain-containing protein n=1 Tax=Mucilaginibacter mallensis TaxID=652787 RepID=A0A1H1WTN3_MUCMA|nr:triple tyrosine motif-containing protein [Mucilaginibacter mallensis]SDT00628.1 Y_Y_Y domain-containing protein [Mucilaginibacter mallensis]
MNRAIFFIAIYLFSVSPAFAQTTIGLPAIRNYKSNDYNAATQIYDAKQDKAGILYFANDDGLLTFDGNYWKVYPMPNHTSIKSIAIDASGKIYAGGQDEVGYFYPNQYGVLKFHSIKKLLPLQAKQFADIWDIIIDGDHVFFRTIEAIFQYKNNHITVFDAPDGWKYLTKVNQSVFAFDKETGLSIFKKNNWETQIAKPALKGMRITGICNYSNDTLLVTSQKQGLYLLHGQTLTKKTTQIDAIIANDLVNCVQRIDSNKYAIGTVANGLLIINAKGQLIQKLSNTEGLQNSNVYRILADHDKNIWLGLENGVSFINSNTSVKSIYPVKGNQTVSSAIKIFDKKLFIGTSNGLYNIPLNNVASDISNSNGTFNEVANTKGQVWSLNEIDHKLLLGHQDGAFIVKDNKAVPLMTHQGVWSFQAYPAAHDIIAGTYTGLELLNKTTDGSFTDGGKLEGVYESLNNVTIDNHGNVWASHPYRGVFKIQLSADGKTIIHHKNYTLDNGLPSTQNNHVYFIKNKVLVATEKGLYEYNAATDRFVVSTFFSPVFKNTAVEYLTADNTGNIWFVNDQRVGVIDFSKRTAQQPYTVIYFPELTAQTVKGLEFIYPYNNQNIFIGSNDGVFHLNYSKYTQSAMPLKVMLSTVKAIADKDSLIFGGYFFNENNAASDQNLKQVISLPNQWNSFHFEYSSSLYAQKSNVEFKYKLKGFDQAWSAWSVKTEKDYTNLPYGIYTFSVIARNNLGNESQPVNYTFIITPAWYQTAWIYLFYVVLAVILIRIFTLWQRRRFAIQQRKHEEEQARLSYLHGLELDRNEKEIIALKNQNLEAELQFKNKELATITMHLVERGGILINFKQALLSLVKKTKIPDAEYEFRSVFKLLNEIEKNADDWNHFAIYFDQVHNNFLTIIKAKFPDLSSTDLKLCAYLRLNLSSKEIAQLMNISLKGVEISRYRIRKKLNLATEINLYDFLIEAVKNPL